LGDDPRMAITTTPRNIPALKALMDSGDMIRTHSTTRQNSVNLPRSYLRMMERRYGGTELGRQEIDGELIDDNTHAVWQRAWIERHRVRTVPELQRVIVAIDPPAGLRASECGIVVAGKTEKGEGYVLADRSQGGLTAARWARLALETFEEFKADGIVAEANQGGEMVRSVLQQQTPNAPVKLVFAARDKRSRAQPIGSLYERGLIHHAGYFAELEDQMCQFDGTGPSPDRMDALVWALSELFPLTLTAEPKIWSVN
jgi:phage terminase large subunit-like protein